MPDSLAALARLGVTITDGAAVPLRGIRFIDSISSVEAPFPNGCGVGIRRTALHQLLVEGAREAGVEMLWNTRVRAVLPGRVTAGSSVWECRWTVAADGENSRVRRWMKLDRRRHERVRFGFRRHYRVKRWTDLVEVYWSHGCQMVITPIDADEVCVAITTPNSPLRLQAALKLFPQAARHLEGVDANTPEKGAVSALAPVASCFSRLVCLGRRCQRFGGCHYGRGFMPDLPPGGSARRRHGTRRSRFI